MGLGFRLGVGVRDRVGVTDRVGGSIWRGAPSPSRRALAAASGRPGSSSHTWICREM